MYQAYTHNHLKNRLVRSRKLKIKKKKLKEVITRKKKWYEKFRWFVSSEGFLCIGGRDATTNDILVKKHMEKGDLVFHTQLAGSPFFIIKSEGKKIGKKTIEEAAQATASYSRAWKHGFTVTEVYYITPEQVKKEIGATYPNIINGVETTSDELFSVQSPADKSITVAKFLDR